MKVARVLFMMLLASAGCRAAEPAPPKPLLTILYTAEAHAALLPCECPLQPLGGVARRAALINQYRQRGPVVVVDAGGWASGGIYDEDTDGDPARDQLRSELMQKAMQEIGYDGVVLCPQDLAARSQVLPLTLPGATAMPLVLKDKFALPIRIFGWDEASAPQLPRLAAMPPSDFSAAHSEKFFDVHLCRLGEEGAESLANATHGDVIVSAGRKSTQRIGWHSGETTLANFDYEAQRLGVIEVFPGEAGASRKFDVRVRFEPLTAQIPDDPKIAAMLAPHLQALKKKSKEKIQIEFWTMPECPYCAQIRPDIERIAKDLAGRVEVTFHFVLHRENGKFGSLHGPREYQEARLQAVIRTYYPEKMWEWAAWRDTAREAPWEEGAKKFGMLPARIRGALAENEADQILEKDYELMQRRHVEGTPSLVIGNRMYAATDGSMERQQILRVLCANLSAPAPAACKDVPACFFDAQCKKRGFVGKCSDAGKPGAACDFSKPAVVVPAVVIDDRENVYDNYEHILDLIVNDLPGLQHRVIDVSTPEARTLIEKLKLVRLPAYVLDAVAKTETNFEDGIGKVVSENAAEKKLVVQPLAVGAHRLLNRERIKGRVDLFVSRFSKSGQESLEAALEYVKTLGADAPELVVHDALYLKQKDEAGSQELAASGGIAELEEAARALAVRKIAPEKFEAYLLERGKKRGSSYWDVALNTLKIDANKVRELADAPEILAQLQAEAALLKNIEAGGEISFLGENCELIAIRSREDLRHTLEAIGRHRPRK